MGTTTGTLLFEAIPRDVLTKVRAERRDEAGNALAVQVDEEGGSPLRCCLREARPGDRLLLIAYTPPGTVGAYAERGPVFIHAENCEGYETRHAYPPELRHRRQIVRAYGQDGRIADAVLANDGAAAEVAIKDLLGRTDVALVHVRNVEYGCYNFAVVRAGTED